MKESSCYGFVIYSPYPKRNPVTYGAAVENLKVMGHDAELVVELGALERVVATFAKCHEKVLLLSHSILPLPILNGCCQPNVFYFGGRALDRRAQMKWLRETGVATPAWRSGEFSWQKLFDDLGSPIVAKPNCYGSHASNGIKFLFSGESLASMTNYCFQEYVGTRMPPFRKTRVNALFGRAIVACDIVVVRPENQLRGLGPGDRILPVTDSVAAVDVARFVSFHLALDFGCGMVGVDFLWKGDEPLCVEFNATNVSLNGKFGESTGYDPTINVGRSIAEAVLEHIEIHCK